MKKAFKEFAATAGNPNWEKLTSRQSKLYTRDGDIRTPFARDYTRVLHSMAYRRLKHKTQVFFNINNDHICTRMEHVSHVESVSSTIAKVLGLNEELTKAISIGHDLGHAPFGHQGESIIKELSQKYLGLDFWHEQNGLRFVDKIELLENPYKFYNNLDLTYAVRDGIISHCGEVDQNGIFPRDISIPIEVFDTAGKYQAVTWEGCVVKMADKIAYVGRDIEDAIVLGFLGQEEQNQLLKMARILDERAMNTTVIIHNMILDICRNSSPETGICMSSQFNDLLQEIKDFNYKYIYQNAKFEPFKQYSRLVIIQIFNVLFSFYEGKYTWEKLDGYRSFAPTLVETFERWLAQYCAVEIIPERLKKISICYENEKIYQSLQTEQLYAQAIIDYIAGMTDRFAIAIFNELLEY